MISRRAKRLHQSPWVGVFYVTGGGSGLLHELLATPGASATVLEARVPYAHQALTELLGRAPEQACSGTTVRSLAMRAFERALALKASQPFGFACSASLATNRRKRGRHRAHLAIQTATETHSLEVSFHRDTSRAEQEHALLEHMWRLIRGALLGDKPHPRSVCVTGTPAWRALLRGTRTHAPYKSPSASLLLPGAFNPLHDGHREMRRLAESFTGTPCAYELSVTNVDKPMLDYLEIEERSRRFDAPYWLTRLPTFVEKSEVFPGAVFAVGADTMARIAQPRYYGDSVKTRNAAIRHFEHTGTRFLVFGRMMDGQFKSVSALALPAALKRLCEPVPESVYRNDISSTEIRNGTTTQK